METFANATRKSLEEKCDLIEVEKLKKIMETIPNQEENEKFKDEINKIVKFLKKGN